MAVQINGQVKYKINVPRDADDKQVEEAALADERAAGYIGGRSIVKVIVVKGRLINIVVR